MLGYQMGCHMVPLPAVESGNWGLECHSLLYRVLAIALREQHNIPYTAECCVLERLEDVDRFRNGSANK